MFFEEPRYNVIQNESEVLIEVELPGFSGNELDISTEKGLLYIKGQRNRKVIKLSFSIPRDVDINMIEASMENGLLVVKLPHLESAKKRKIEIKGAGVTCQSVTVE